MFIPKGQRRFGGFDHKIIAMYAQGMTVREIQRFLEEQYKVEVSADLISTVTDSVMGDVLKWQLGLEFFPADVTRSEEVQKLAQHVQSRFGKIDIAFNNAGIARCVPSEECTDEAWQSVIDTDLSGVFYCCREFGKVMLAQGRGTIINTASMSGIVSNIPQPQCAYNAAKAGVIMLTKSLAGEWAKRGVRVNSVSPGYVNTSMTPKNEIRSDWYDLWMTVSPMGRIAEPQEIAPAVVFLSSDASSFVTGSNLVVDGGYTCW